VPERYRAPVRNILWHQTVLPKLAREHALDVVHVPSYRRLLWRRPCPRVATIHDLAPFHVAGKYDWKRTLYGRSVARRLARRQEEIIAVSDSTARDITRFFGIARERITVVHNGVEHERFFPGSREPAIADAAKYHDLRKPFFLYVARLEHPGKNHVRLIEAFNRFKAATPSDWQLAFGGSDWDRAEVIHNAIQQSRFAKDIRKLGFVPDDRLPNLYRAADVFVYPSLYEGFGMPPTEAMACGCPVICSTRGSLGEIAENAAVIVDPEDVDSIARRLTTLAESPVLRERLRLAGLARAGQFNWQRSAAETLKVYERAAAQVPKEGQQLAARIPPEAAGNMPALP